MPRLGLAKNWCWTWNNYPLNYKRLLQDALQDLADNGYVYTYLVCGQETAPTTGTPHLQGFVCFNKAVPFNTLRLAWTADFSVARHLQNSIDYCMKGEQPSEEWKSHRTNGQSFGLNAVIFTLGQRPVKKGQQGKRTDTEDFQQAVKEAFANGEWFTERDAYDSFPNVCAQYPNFVRNVIQFNKPLVSVEQHELRPWQVHLNQRLNRPTNSRQIIFVVDTRGNAGKSWFAKHYRSLHDNVQIMDGGRFQNMAYMIDDNVRVVFFDLPRDQVEVFNWYFLEKLKDGEFDSSKYVPYRKQLRQSPHVVVMMNSQPPVEKFSADRVKVIDCNDRFYELNAPGEELL